MLFKIWRCVVLKNWLDYLSEDYNISFYEISKKTGIAQSTLSNIRRKNISYRDVRFATILAISNSLGMTLDDMYLYLRKSDVVVI